MNCQILTVRQPGPCSHQEGGGRWCERTDDHGDRHHVGDHTIAHEKYGNGWSCEAVDRFLAQGYHYPGQAGVLPYTIVGFGRRL